MAKRSMRSRLNEYSEMRSDIVGLMEEANKLLKEQKRPTVIIESPGKLKLSFLGRYNVGKSTLVNALLGEKIAKTGDSPETKLVKSYTWNNFDIVDLPGLDARPSEEATAHQALKDAHAVLYVVSSQSGFDQDELWTDLQKLKELKLPFLVVINDKQAHQSDQDEQSYQRTIISNFDRNALKHLIADHHCDVYWINALRAERGREECKPIFVRTSGIELLEDALIKYMTQKDNFLRELSKLSEVSDSFESIEKTLEQKIDSKEEKRLQEIIRECETISEQMGARAITLADEQFFLLSESVISTLKRGVSTKNIDWEPIQKEIADIIETTFGTALELYSEELLTAIGPYYQKAFKEITEFGNKVHPQTSMEGLPKFEAQKLDIEKLISRAGSAAAAMKTLIDLVKESASESVKQGAKQLGANIGKQTAEGIVQSAASEGAKAGIKEGVKDGVEESAKQGGKALGKVLGPAIMVAAAAWEIWQGFKQADKEKQLIELALNEVTNRGKLLSANAKQLFIKETAVMRRSLVFPLTEHLRSNLQQMSKTNIEINDQLSRLSKLRTQLNNARENLFHETTK